MGFIELQIIFAFGVQQESAVQVFAEFLLLVFPFTDLLVRPGFDIFSNVWYQKVHGFVEASSVFGGCIINGNPDLPGHLEDVNEMRQIDL